MSMTIDEMIAALNAIKEKVGGGERIPIVLVGWGNTDYVEASHPIVGDFCDQNGKTFKCAFVGCLEGTEFTRKGVSFLHWKWEEDMLPYDVEKADEKPCGGCQTGTGALLHVKLDGAYWEDAEVKDGTNGEELSGEKMPGYKGGTVDWDIDPKTGRILDWPSGVTARTWYKVCDGFSYDYERFHYGPTYVPDFMSLEEKGYGDYVYLSIGPDGRIKNWSEETFLKEHARLVGESRG